MPLRASPCSLHNKLPLACLKVDPHRCAVSMGCAPDTLERKELIPTLTAEELRFCSLVEMVVVVIHVYSYFFITTCLYIPIMHIYIFEYIYISSLVLHYIFSPWAMLCLPSDLANAFQINKPFRVNVSIWLLSITSCDFVAL